MRAVIYFTGRILLLCLFLQSCAKRDTVPDLRETFRYNDDRLNGGSFAYKMLLNRYRGVDTYTLNQDFNYINSMQTGGNAVYYTTASNLLMTEGEAQNLSSYVKLGNTVFLSCKFFDDTVLDNFLLKATNYKPGPFEIPYNFGINKIALEAHGDEKYNTSFSYYYLPFINSFSEINYANYKILGRNSKGVPNFIVYFWGKGKLFLHCDPAALSNHFLMTGNNYKYFEKILSYLPEAPTKIYIDDYYCNKNYKEGDDDKSLLAMIYARPALAWAFSILLAAFLLYLILNIKRMQRIMPVRKPVVNDSVNFVEAISTLYYKKKDNKNIADKMISYFYDDLRSKYFITNTQMSTDLVATLSHKSGMAVEDTQRLFYNIKMVQDSDTVTDEHLLELNKLIYKFKNFK